VNAKVLWTPQAREDLLEIYVAIGIDNLSAAERFYTAIEDKAKLLSSNPRLGRGRPEIRPSTRLLIQDPYLILYETHPDTTEGPIREVEIVRVIDGRRDLTRLF
jgi:toxin ParE1/3/4